MLLPHAKRDALFFIAEPHDLEEIAVAVRDDDASTIQALLESGDMRRPTDEEKATDPEVRFRFVIVQPFVLAQGPLLDS